MVAAIVSAVFDSNGSLRKQLPSDCHTSGVDRHRNSPARVFDRKGNLWRSYRTDSFNDHGLLPLLRHARYGIAGDGHDHLFRCPVGLALATCISIRPRKRLVFSRPCPGGNRFNTRIYGLVYYTFIYMDTLYWRYGLLSAKT